MPETPGTEPVILDCDNMMGAVCREIDDGLALCALMGSARVELLGVTTSFGNGSIKRVHRHTKELVAAFGQAHIEVQRGAASPNFERTNAAAFLAEMAAARPGEITLIATGPLTNLAAAAAIDDNFFGNLKRIVCMGGWRGPFRLGHRRLKEVNLISDAPAARLVLSAPVPVVIADGDLCRQVVFDRRDVATLCQVPGLPDWVRGSIRRWATLCRMLGISPGICPWDLVAAAYVLQPEEFLTHSVGLRSNEFDFTQGRLRLAHARGCDRVTLLTHVVDPGAILNVLHRSLTALCRPLIRPDAMNLAMDIV